MVKEGANAMQNFYYDIPTKVYFGEGQIKHLPALVSQYGKRVLLVYGGGSVKRSGLYDTIKSLLEDAGITSWDLAGVEPRMAAASPESVFR